MKRTCSVLLALLAVGCVRQKPARLPASDHAYVAVLSGEMPGSFRDLARHSWVVASLPGRRWRHYEWLGQGRADDIEELEQALTSDVIDGDVAIHGVKEGSPEEIATIVACLERETEAYKDFNCGCWPGPNSNTFVDLLIRTCGLGIELPATAIGKDYRGPIGVSFTEGQTGVQLESWVIGAKIGLKEGIQADMTGLSLGVHFWPPGFEVPLNPGWIGATRGSVKPRNPDEPEAFAWRPDDVLEHRYGSGRISMLVDYTHVRGLTDVALVGLTGRGVYAGRGHVGLAAGFDLEIGAAAPLGFGYRTSLSPLGVGVVIGDMGFAGITSGIGTSGASFTVKGRLELPEEARVEIDVNRLTRFGLRAGVVVVPAGGFERNFAEWFAGSTVRLGTRASGRDAMGGGGAGYFIGLDRRQIMKTYSLGLSFGYELGVGG